MEALAPYRLPFTRPADEPQPLAYLDDAGNRAQGVIDIELEVLLETAQIRLLWIVAEVFHKAAAALATFHRV